MNAARLMKARGVKPAWLLAVVWLVLPAVGISAIAEQVSPDTVRCIPGNIPVIFNNPF